MYSPLKAARSTAHPGRTLVAAAGAILLAASAASAQTIPSHDRSVTIDPAILLERAETLHATPPRWYEAAVLYQESARTLDEGDPLAVRSLRLSAQLLHSVGSPALAAETLERAAAMALAAGDTAMAAECLLEAAHVARERGDGQGLRRAVRAIQVLAARSRHP